MSRSREARLWELPEFFRRSVPVEKVCWAYFLTESEALPERPAEEGLRRIRMEDAEKAIVQSVIAVASIIVATKRVWIDKKDPIAKPKWKNSSFG